MTTMQKRDVLYQPSRDFRYLRYRTVAVPHEGLMIRVDVTEWARTVWRSHSEIMLQLRGTGMPGHAVVLMDNQNPMHYHIVRYYAGFWLWDVETHDDLDTAIAYLMLTKEQP